MGSSSGYSGGTRGSSGACPWSLILQPVHSGPTESPEHLQPCRLSVLGTTFCLSACLLSVCLDMCLIPLGPDLPPFRMLHPYWASSLSAPSCPRNPGPRGHVHPIPTPRDQTRSIKLQRGEHGTHKETDTQVEVLHSRDRVGELAERITRAPPRASKCDLSPAERLHISKNGSVL